MFLPNELSELIEFMYVKLSQPGTKKCSINNSYDILRNWLINMLSLGDENLLHASYCGILFLSLDPMQFVFKVMSRHLVVCGDY